MEKYHCTEKITIGVAAYGNLEITKKCVEAVKNSKDGKNKIRLVDDCSPDNGLIKEYFLSLKNEFKDIKIFYFSENLGYIQSVNCILSHATGDKIIFVSNDIIINSYFIGELINISNISENIGYVRGVSNFVDTNLKTHNVDLKSFTNKNPNDIAKEILKKNKNNYFEEEYLCGDCFLVNRALLQKIGYFDCKNFKDYLGDLDFGIRAKAFNFKCIVSEGAFCYHHAGINFDYLPDDQKKIKLRRRNIFLMEDWARFKLKYDFPINLIYPGVNTLDFNKIRSKVNKKYEINKKDYSKYLI